MGYNSKYTGAQVEAMLEKAETALQEVPEGYATSEDLAGKQDVISDLDTIRSGAMKGATALQAVPSEYVTETELTAKGYATSATATKNYNKIISRGLQLVVNGSGMMGNNTNFSKWTFDGAKANNSAGSFTYPAKAILMTDEFFLVNPTRRYTLSFDMMSLAGKATMYAFLDQYTIDKERISAGTHMHISASTTTLAQDLVAGDTVVYLTSTSGWSTTVANANRIIFWNDVNSYGYQYPTGTYSRNRLSLLANGNKLSVDGLDTTNHTVTLTSAYTGATIPAGTACSQGRDGPTYKYLVGPVITPAEWTTYSGSSQGVDLSGTNVSSMFSPACAYVKVGFLWHYNSAANDRQWVTNVSVMDTTEEYNLKQELLSYIDEALGNV